MLKNSNFLNSLKEAFLKYLVTGPRSNEKLKILHSSIAEDLSERLGNQYQIFSLHTDNQRSKEVDITGRYLDKTVDITVKLGKKNIAGIAVKFVMSNYSQNNVNYFENMLGETANIRSAQIQYFQIFIIPDSVPYYNRDRRISKWEFISSHNLAKYQKLSEDNIDNFMHTPNKTLIFIIHLPKIEAKSEQEYKEFFLQNKGFEITTSQQEFDFGDRVIYNDYELFMQKVVFSIKSI